MSNTPRAVRISQAAQFAAEIRDARASAATARQAYLEAERTLRTSYELLGRFERQQVQLKRLWG